MKRIFCDKCGEEISSGLPPLFGFGFGNLSPFEIYEPSYDYEATLCPKCARELIKWIGKEDPAWDVTRM